MKQRKLGLSGLTVSAIGLGCMSMSQSYGALDDDESIRTIHRALDLGVTFFDTAAIYGQGHNETLVGRALGLRRKGIVLATKCGILPASGGGIDADGSLAEIRASCEASLRRLGTDVIDLLYLHRVDPKTPIEKSIGALAGLVRDGKVRFIGVSEAAPPTIRRAQKVHPIAALQSEYSLWFRGPEQDVLPICRELGIGFVPFSPLGRGFLSGSLKDTETLAPDDMRRPVAALPGREFWTQSGAGPTTRGDGGAQTLHTGPARAGVAAREREGHRADPGHEATEVRGRERGGGGHRTDDGGDVGARADVPVECCRGKSLQRADGSSHRYNGFVANVLGATRAASGRERPSERFPAWRPRRDAT